MRETAPRPPRTCLDWQRERYRAHRAAVELVLQQIDELVYGDPRRGRA